MNLNVVRIPHDVNVMCLLINFSSCFYYPDYCADMDAAQTGEPTVIQADMTGVATQEKASSSKKKSERKCATKEEYRQLSSIMGVMNNLRKQGTLCDVTLVVQGKHFPAHRVVLAAASHFFSLMFTTRMMESMSHEVELRSAEPEIIELLIEFIYTARISVNSSNVQSLLDAANQYQIEPVKKMCAEFLKGQIDATNCLGISALADCMDCPELKAAAEDFFQLHFTEVYKLDEFLQLDVTQLTHLLHQDTLTVRAEAQIYDAAVRWLKFDVCNRKRYMVEVLGCVRFPLVSKTFLSKTVQAEPLIQDNPQCLKMVISGMRYHLLSLEDREDLGENSRPRRKKHDYRIALFGGSQPQSCRYFNPKDSSWTDIRCPFEKRRDASAVFWDNVVYILGGSQLFPIKRMDCYNVLKDSWYSKLGPPTPRDSLAACAAQGKIYTSGGSEVGSSALALFECYDTRTESWQVKSSMLMARCSHGSVAANGLIYVCGGTVGNNVSGRVLNNFEVYDPSTSQWRELCGMREARKNHGLAVVNSRIYAVGGQGALGGLDSVEYYDIATNEWRPAAPMPWRGVTVKCAAVGDVIYVLEGFQAVGRLGHVLEYHTETDRWVTCSKVRAFPVTCCLICVVDTCGVNEDEDMDLIESQSHPATSTSKSASS
ncbi:kelch-like protein 7 [Labrus mixtus]|uniref:kelch-like protein 7 n=1 Tax=Labrus mixtus TaxID=508554 RepID=UPI0029C0E91D|nr:kelch-like protein 7 [Labrus mixtus]